MSEQVVKRYSLSEFAEQHTHPVGPGTYVEATDYDALHAEAEALQQRLATEQGNAAYWKEQYQVLRNDYQRTVSEKVGLSTELEAARGLLQTMRRHTDEPNGYKYPVSMWFPQIDALLTTTPAPEVRQADQGAVTVERDMMGTMHIKLGDFDAVQVRYQYPYTDNASTKRLAKRIAEMLRNPLAEQGERQEAVPEETPHIIVFDDADRPNEVFSGAGARPAALRRWKQISVSWNAHLFVRVEKNSRDDPNPCARLATTPQPGPDVRGLVEATSAYLNALDSGADDYDVKRARHNLRHELATHRQAQQGGSHD